MRGVAMRLARRLQLLVLPSLVTGVGGGFTIIGGGARIKWTNIWKSRSAIMACGWACVIEPPVPLQLVCGLRGGHRW